MRLRVKGTVAECMAAVDALTTGFVVRAVSDFYADRVADSYGMPGFGRVYIDADLIVVADAPIKATASRTDNPTTRRLPRALLGGRRGIEQKGDRS